MKDIPNTCEIKGFMHCVLCLEERPDGISPKDYARLEVGWTAQGFQVWCVRHEANVMHVDFEGQKHPANQTCEVKTKRPYETPRLIELAGRPDGFLSDPKPTKRRGS